MAVKIQIEVDDKGSIKIDQFAGKVKGAGSVTEHAGKRMAATWQRVERGINSMHNRIRRFATGLPAMLGFAGAIAGVTAFGKSLISAGMTIENFETQWSVLLGSMDLAKKRMRELSEFAATTPFQIEDINTAAKQMQNFGMYSEENLRIVGDAAAFAQRPIGELAMWFGRLYDSIQSGRPAGEATMRLQELAIISGSARNQIEEMQKSGASAAEVWATFTDNLGTFSGMMERQSQTMAGMISNLKDKWFQFKVFVGEKVFNVLKSDIEKVLAKIDEWYENGKMQEWAEDLGAKIKDVYEKLFEFGKWITEHGGLIKKLAVGFLLFGAAVETSNLAINIAAITKAIGLLNVAAGTGFFAKMISAVGVSGAMAFAGAAAVIGTTIAAVNETAKDWNKTHVDLETQLNKLLNEGYKIEKETDNLYKVIKRANGEWEKTSYFFFEATEELDALYAASQASGGELEKLGESLTKAGNAGQTAANKIKDAMKGMELRQVEYRGKPPLAPVGDIREKIGEAQIELIGVQETVVQIGTSIDTAGAKMEDFGNKIIDAGKTIGEISLDRFTSGIAHAIVYGQKLKNVFADIGQMIAEMVIKFALMTALNAIIPGGGMAIGFMHKGGPVPQGGPVPPRLHSGIGPDEYPAILQRGEYVTPRSAVNAKTLPVLQQIRETGKAPGQNINVTIAGDRIEIHGGDMDRTMVEQIRETVQQSRENLAAEIEYLLETRQLVIGN